MASHHHCHHHQQQQQSHHHSTCYSDYCTCNCTCTHLPPPQPDPLLIQALATQLLQEQQQHIYTQYLHKPHHQQQRKSKQYFQENHQDQEPQRNEKSQALLLNSLLQRIEALESSLKHVSPSSSLRDFAARTIQIHFRAFLVRRSRTLRNLKHLAIIKSSFYSLKSSISDQPYFNHDAVSHKAMDLLHKLDSIQGGDPMIRDGKRTICRELVQILEYIDEMSIRRKQIYSNAMKKVRFAEDNHGYRACKGGQENFINEDVEGVEEKGASVSSDEQKELMDTLCKKIENIEGFTRVYEDDEEESTSSKRNHGNQSPRSNLKTDFGNGDFFPGINGNPFFSAPMPVQMESMREDLMKKEKIVRVAR